MVGVAGFEPATPSSRTRSHSSRSLKDQHFLVKFVCVCSRSVRRKLWPKLWPGVSSAMWTAVERAGTCSGYGSLTLDGSEVPWTTGAKPDWNRLSRECRHSISNVSSGRAAAPLIGAVRTRTAGKAQAQRIGLAVACAAPGVVR